jgi:hypothetical protein
MMKEIDKLLAKAKSFERIATYGDRKAFLKALAQTEPGLPPGPYEPISSHEPVVDTKNQSTLPEEPSYPQSRVPESQLKDINKMPQTTTPAIVDKFKDTIYPKYDFMTSSEPKVNEANALLQKAEPLLVAGKPWLKVQEYTDIRSKLLDMLTKLKGTKGALLTEPKTQEAGPRIAERIKDINNTIPKLESMVDKLFSIYNKLNTSGIKEKF